MNLLSSDIVLESIRLIILLIIIIHLWNVGKNRKELLGNGWNLFFNGFLLLLFGNILDITDNFESLNRFIIIGDTEIEAFLEKMVGFLGGFLLIAIGLIRWIPAITSVDKLQKEIDKHEETGRMLRNEKNLAQKYLDIVKVIIVVIDSNQRVTLINKNGSEVLGYSKKDIIGRNWFDTFIPEEIRQEIKSFFEKILAEDIDSVEPFENTILTKNGKERIISWNNTILKNENGNIIGILSSGEDITERKQAEAAMFNAKLSAEAASRTKSEFIANISHELRTPLNSIIGFSGVLYNESHGPLNESQKKYTSIVLRNGKNLLNIINDIISISNIETRKMELHIDEFFVSDAIDEVEALMRPIASKKDIGLTCNIDIETPTIKADTIKFKQILYNLVSNAIKFTDQCGSVTIEGKISEHIVHISVKDSGIGISPEDQDKLFNPFFQADSSTTRKFGGTGLGLALVKKFVEIHDGQIWVDSEVGKGSTFTFRIPTAFETTSF